ncbi:hypothetical protein [Gordonibacter sp. An230]|uniref:hypothetical protein n=1 Tax=Gordonibacter sp. An230 TaxID=1965592 RepID=UPI0011203166|nr:hypothetical protein [Gordonibacter sp. An230]
MDISIKGRIEKVSLVLFVFCAVFSPPIIPDVNFVLVAAFFALISLLAFHKDEIRGLMRRTGAGLYSTGIGFYVVYCLAITTVAIVFGGDRFWLNYMTALYSVFLLCPVSVVCALYISVKAKKLSLDFSGVLLIFIAAGMVEACFTLAAFLNSEVRQMLIDIMSRNTDDAIFSNATMLSWRFYGFSNSLLDLFGFTTGIIASLPLFVSSIRGQKRWILLVPPLLLVPFLNSRSGLVIFVVCFAAYLLLFIKKDARLVVVTPALMAILFIGVAIILNVVKEVAPSTADWVTMDVDSFLSSGSTITGQTLFSDAFWELPSGILFLTGTGHTKYLVEGFAHSDVGYVNQLWRCGVIGSLAMYITHFILYRRCVGRNASVSGSGKVLVLAIFVSFLVMQVKGDCFVYTGAMVLFLTLCFFSGMRQGLSAQRHIGLADGVRLERKPLVTSMEGR